MQFTKFIFASAAILFLESCSTNSTDSAGILIETNTGNKTARILVSSKNLGINAGDTLVLNQTHADTLGDTIFVSKINYTRIADSLECNSGIMVLDSFPVGKFDSVKINSANGNSKSVFVSWNVVEDSLNFDSSLDAEFKGAVTLALPSDFKDLENANELYENMPFALQLSQMKNPCILDVDGNLIRLTKTDSNLYRGIMPQVIFKTKNQIQFDLVNQCQESDSLNLKFANHAEFFDELKNDNSSILGYARWSDSTDNWYYIDNVKIFSDDNYGGISIWFNADSLDLKDYAQIIAAKNDSTGFKLQKRGNSGAVNLRIDTKGGVYNAVFGRANGVLDGKWHQYTFKIHQDTVTTFIDGNLIGETQFNIGQGLSSAINPGIGYGGFSGGVDELYFLTGRESNNWIKLFYALQKSSQE